MAEESARDIHRRGLGEIQSPRGRKKQTSATRQHRKIAERRQYSSERFQRKYTQQIIKKPIKSTQTLKQVNFLGFHRKRGQSQHLGAIYTSSPASFAIRAFQSSSETAGRAQETSREHRRRTPSSKARK